MKPNLDLYHTPTRGSDVEDWLKRHRDHYVSGSTPWTALDDLLEDYRLRADAGLELDDPIERAGE